MEGAVVAEGVKSSKKLKKIRREMTKEKLEEAMEELIYENLDRTGSLFEIPFMSC